MPTFGYLAISTRRSRTSSSMPFLMLILSADHSAIQLGLLLVLGRASIRVAAPMLLACNGRIAAVSERRSPHGIAAVDDQRYA